ncbi:protein kinase family protein [Fulvitalea axinellae]
MFDLHSVKKPKTSPERKTSVTSPVQLILLDWASLIEVKCPAQGLSSEVFFVKLRNGKELVLKFPFNESAIEVERVASEFIGRNTDTLRTPHTRVITPEGHEVDIIKKTVAKLGGEDAESLRNRMSRHSGPIICMEKMEGQTLDFYGADKKLLKDPRFVRRLGEITAFDILLGNIDRLLTLNPDNILFDHKKGTFHLIDQKVSMYELSGMIPGHNLDTDVFSDENAGYSLQLEVMLEVNDRLKHYLGPMITSFRKGDFGGSALSERVGFMFEIEHQMHIDRVVFDKGLYEGFLKIARNFGMAGVEAADQWKGAGAEGAGLFHNWLTVSNLLPDAQKLLAEGANSGRKKEGFFRKPW